MKVIFVILLLTGCSTKITSYQTEKAAKFCATHEGVSSITVFHPESVNSSFQVVCKNGERGSIKYD